jgi:hypothetical protein
MKLSDLINFRNQLNSLPTTEAKTFANLELGKITHLVGVPGEFQQHEVNLINQLTNINSSFNQFDLYVEQLRKTIHEQIAKDEKAWFQESYRLFEQEMCHESAEYILNRRLSITGENTNLASYQSEQVLRTKLSAYADWRFAGMVIRPGLENFIDEMVASDPLYVVDHDHDLLTPCIKRFPKVYQQRLRPYVVNERTNEPIMTRIPDNQFGLCLVYNFFNYRPLEIIRRYLTEIYQKLQPGGCLFMTYNDCDLPQAVCLVEQHFACYTPGYLIRDLAQSIGFELKSTWGDNGPSVWLELHKPGERTSLRGGQALAKIISK